MLCQVDVYKEILSLEMRESEDRPAEEDNQLFRQVCDQLRYVMGRGVHRIFFCVEEVAG